MASDGQILANRRNALKSTGPTTSQGKTASSRNAVKHGLTGREILLPDEDAAAFDALRSAVFGRLEPKDGLEGEIVEQIVGLLWRLRRIPQLEKSLLVWLGQEGTEAEEPHTTPTSTGTALTLPLTAFELPFLPPHVDDRMRGRMLKSALDRDALGKLSRYERDLSHRLREALHKLAVLQARENIRSPFPERSD